MDKFDKVLSVCIGLAKKGGNINVFDLMYETSLSYPVLKYILDRLVLNGELAVIDIKTYKFTGDINRKFEEVKTQEPFFENVEYSSGKDAALEARRACLAERRKELIERMKKDMEDGNDNDEDQESDEDELHYKALKLCIEKGQASVSLLQRSFPIGYLMSCKLIEWMENMGYITASEGVKPREVLMTPDEFEKTFREPNSEDEFLTEEDDDEEEEIDEKFEEYQEYLRCKLGVIDNPEENTQTERLIEFISKLLIEWRVNNPCGIPEHPSWDNENDFIRLCGERLTVIVNSDKKMGKQGALKKATALLESVRDNSPMSEVYECIAFVLGNMSNYYYAKIRDGLI